MSFPKIDQEYFNKVFEKDLKMPANKAELMKTCFMFFDYGKRNAESDFKQRVNKLFFSE